MRPLSGGELRLQVGHLGALALAVLPDPRRGGLMPPDLLGATGLRVSEERVAVHVVEVRVRIDHHQRQISQVTHHPQQPLGLFRTRTGVHQQRPLLPDDDPHVGLPAFQWAGVGMLGDARPPVHDLALRLRG